MSYVQNILSRVLKKIFFSGWLFWLISFFLYAITIQSLHSTESYQLAIAANSLDTTHQHISPLYMLLGRIFSLFAHGNTAYVAICVAFLSVIAGAFSVFFVFRSTLYSVQTFVNFPNSYSPKTQKTIHISVASLAALSFLLSNIVWHSATQIEIFSLLGCFFSAIIYYMLRWHAHKNTSFGLRYIYSIALLLGLAVSVHILALLLLPALVYFYVVSTGSCSVIQKIKTFIIALILLLCLWFLCSYGFFAAAAYSDMFFVNTLGFSLHTGVFVFVAFLIVLFSVSLIFTCKKSFVRLHHFIVILTLFCVGYSLFSVPLIRAHADTPYNVGIQKHAFAITAHHSKHAYSGSLLYGTHFNAQPQGISFSKKTYDFDSLYTPYVLPEPTFHGALYTLFPRMWSTQKNHIRTYKELADIQEEKNTTPLYIHGVNYTKPTFLQNARFFWKYQYGHTYGRYMLWNYVGQQNNFFGNGEPHKGNWLTGLPLVDSYRLGAQDSLPQEYKNNVAHNTYFALPLLFALLGFVFLLRNSKNILNLLLPFFLLSSFGTVFWFNSPPYAPDSLSYMYISSCIIISMCIGFGFIPVYWYISKFTSKHTCLLAVGVSALVSLIMLWQNLDDHPINPIHTHSQYAVEYLTACPPQAILIVKNDDEAASLEYAQSVLHVRQDVRIVTYEKLAYSWYISKLRDYMYTAPPVKLTLSDEKYAPDVNNEMFVVAHSHISHIMYPAHDILSIIASGNLEYKAKVSETQYIDYIPVPKTCISTAEYSQFPKHIYPAIDSSRIVPQICWNLIPKRQFSDDTTITKSQLVLFDILATNNWERPICFSKQFVEYDFFDLHQYCFNTGFYFQLYPMKAQQNYMGIGELIIEQTVHSILNNANLRNTPLSETQNQDICETCINIAYATMAQGNNTHLQHIHNAYTLHCNSVITSKKFEYAYTLLSQFDTVRACKVYQDIFESEKEKLLYFMYVPQKFHAKIIGEVHESLYTMFELFELFELLKMNDRGVSTAASTTIFIEHFFAFSQQLEIGDEYTFFEKNAWISTLSEKNQHIAFWYNKMKVYLTFQ